jgi:hypothetical protein
MKINLFDNFYCGHILQNWIEIHLLVSVMERVDIFKEIKQK